MPVSFRTAFTATTLAFCVLLPYAAHAQDKPPAFFATPSRAREKSPEAAHAQAAKTGPAGDMIPKIFEDSKTGTVRFVINGKDILTIDGGGIHVRGNITYSGIAAQSGKPSPRSPAKPHPEPR